jgi:plasmid stabilization system protein ParE
VILPVTFLRSARAEFVEAAAWYEQRQLGLGTQFITAIDHCLVLASERPKTFPVIHNSIRRVVAERFPYSFYYRMAVDRIVVIAVFHASRKPTIWKQRI